MIEDSRNAWLHFLHARKLVIDELIDEGQTPDQVARTLSMDQGQVVLIAMTPVKLPTGVRPGHTMTLEKG
jgi:hypothetical protein